MYLFVKLLISKTCRQILVKVQFLSKLVGLCYVSKAYTFADVFMVIFQNFIKNYFLEHMRVGAYVWGSTVLKLLLNGVLLGYIPSKGQHSCF